MSGYDSEKCGFFTKNLMKWHKHSNFRMMPWKYEKNPYKIWLSEIILQQTRVEQGTAYYNNFLKKFPNIHKLASAEDSEVFKVWEGLGYYSRCKNLIHTARYVSHTLNGIFPTTYEGLLKLKGIGPYTAAAIVSFAYNEPYAVLDGNVMRVLTRFFGLKVPIDTPEGKNQCTHLADILIDKKNAGLYNQAIMDFGATVCKPKSPVCSSCNLSKHCTALLTNETEKFPVKSRKIIKKNRFFYYVVASFKGKFYVRKRVERDIWQNLYEFMLIERAQKSTVDSVLQHKVLKAMGIDTYAFLFASPFIKQQLTHQTIEACFIQIELGKKQHIPGFELVDVKAMKRLAFPKLIKMWIQSLI
jgi:A/G-specific adenine glycosylase